jgi:hypothetical protein
MSEVKQLYDINQFYQFGLKLKVPFVLRIVLWKQWQSVK